MTHENNAPFQQVQAGSLAKLMLLGATIGLGLISFFVLGVDQPRPEWGKFWMIRPLLVTPTAGAMGGIVFYLLDYFRVQGSLQKILANVVGVFIWIVGLWMGIILGLAGTMWH